jgi:hypothetical protein
MNIGSKQGWAPKFSLNHAGVNATHLYDAKDAAVVSANNDTIYPTLS